MLSNQETVESSLVVGSREEPEPNCKDVDVCQAAVSLEHEEHRCRDEQGTPRRQDLTTLPSEGIVIR